MGLMVVGVSVVGEKGDCKMGTYQTGARVDEWFGDAVNGAE